MLAFLDIMRSAALHWWSILPGTQASLTNAPSWVVLLREGMPWKHSATNEAFKASIQCCGPAKDNRVEEEAIPGLELISLLGS